MKTSIDHSNKANQALQDLSSYCLDMEYKNAMLKQVIQVMAGSMALDEEGNTTMQMTDNEAKFVKRICQEANVFGEDHD